MVAAKSKKPEKHFKMYGNTNWWFRSQLTYWYKNAGSQANISQWHKFYPNPETASIYKSRIPR